MQKSDFGQKCHLRGFVPTATKCKVTDFRWSSITHWWPMVTWRGSVAVVITDVCFLLWRRRVSQTGSLMLVVHSTHVQLPGRKSICRYLSGHTALDTSGRDLIFCFMMTELGQDSQLEK